MIKKIKYNNDLKSINKSLNQLFEIMDSKNFDLYFLKINNYEFYHISFRKKLFFLIQEIRNLEIRCGFNEIELLIEKNYQVEILEFIKKLIQFNMNDELIYCLINGPQFLKKYLAKEMIERDIKSNYERKRFYDRKITRRWNDDIYEQIMRLGSIMGFLSDKKWTLDFIGKCDTEEFISPSVQKDKVKLYGYLGSVNDDLETSMIETILEYLLEIDELNILKNYDRLKKFFFSIYSQYYELNRAFISTKYKSLMNHLLNNLEKLIINKDFNICCDEENYTINYIELLEHLKGTLHFAMTLEDQEAIILFNQLTEIQQKIREKTKNKKLIYEK